MIKNCRYDSEYAVYDYVNEAECLLEEKKWGTERFVVLDDNNILVGELTTEFFRPVSKDSEDDGYIEIETLKSDWISHLQKLRK